jgi:hypothetical protein
MRCSLAVCLLLLGLVGCGGTAGVDGGQPIADGGSDVGVDAAIDPVDAAHVDDAGSDAGAIVDVGLHDAGPTDQCTNTADRPITEMSSTPSTVASCGSSSFGGEPALMNCITSMTGLSAGCAGCYDGEVHCVIAHCLSAGCATAPNGASCVACRNAMCHPAFMSCSGLP